MCSEESFGMFKTQPGCFPRPGREFCPNPSSSRDNDSLREGLGDGATHSGSCNVPRVGKQSSACGADETKTDHLDSMTR